MASDSDNFTYEDLVDEISDFMQANRDISELEFQCLLVEAFKTGNETTETYEKIKKVETKLSEKKPGKKKSRLSVQVMLVFLVVVPSVLYISYLSNHSVPKSVYKVAANYLDLPPYLDLYYYLYLRPIRMISIYFGIPQLQALPECYIPNPFIPEEPVPEMFADECKCPGTKHILAVSPNSTKKDGAINLSGDFLVDQPILLKHWGSKISVLTLRNILRRSGSLISEVPNTVSSNHDAVTSMKQFVNLKTFDEVSTNSSFHLEWLSTHYIGSSVIKELFPLPQLVKSIYFDTARILLMDGSTSDAYELPQPRVTYISAYIQGTGSRKIILSPKYPCENRCRFLSARMEVGDILLFSMSAYSARSEHVDGLISLSSVVALDDGDQ